MSASFSPASPRPWGRCLRSCPWVRSRAGQPGTWHFASLRRPAASAAVRRPGARRGLLRRAAAQGRGLEASAPPPEGADWPAADGPRAGPRGPAAVTAAAAAAAAEGSGSEGAVDVGAAASCAHRRGGGGRGHRGSAVGLSRRPEPGRVQDRTFPFILFFEPHLCSLSIVPHL